MLTRPLTLDDFEVAYAGFLEAFSDYVVKMSPTQAQLKEMLTRRGYAAEASAGVFEGDRLVAFALNGIEGKSAYNSGTGVISSHRRNRLGTEVMKFSYSLLRARGCTSYLLEVLEQNRAAIGLYESCGFVRRRSLQCWSFEAADPEGIQPEIHPGPYDWSSWQRWWSTLPAWQNSGTSLQRARDQRVVLGNHDGYAIVFPSTGDLPQLAVRPEARRRSLGTKLLQDAAAEAKKPLRILHLDDSDSGIARFLENAGAVRTHRVLEMELKL
ncbi:MAG: GNAT family N-acetyltransferase [Acidobacteriales bacterium]|nr:GNAT family N-acetyltransferase [Terriglobales bacterium]